jgi:hypothetical protein
LTFFKLFSLFLCFTSKQVVFQEITGKSEGNGGQGNALTLNRGQRGSGKNQRGTEGRALPCPDRGKNRGSGGIEGSGQGDLPLPLNRYNTIKGKAIFKRFEHILILSPISYRGSDYPPFKSSENDICFKIEKAGHLPCLTISKMLFNL